MDFSDEVKESLLIEHYSLDVRKIYDSSICIVHPTMYGEGLPRIYLEAAASGVPVITTKNPGYVDFYEDFKTSNNGPFKYYVSIFGPYLDPLTHLVSKLH